MKVNNGRMPWLKNDNNPSHCMKCLNVYCGQAISLHLQFEFHCKCYFCSTYPQLGLVEPIFSDMDEKALPLLNVNAVYLNSIIIAEMSKRSASDDSSSNNDEFHEPLPQKLPPRKLAHWLPTHQREVIDALHQRVAKLVLLDSRHLWLKTIRNLPKLEDPLYWIKRNQERSK